MKLYDGGRAPNPRRTRIYLAEKGIKLPTEQIDLGAMQQRSPAYAAINPIKRVPALVLDDGTVITESIAICRYFEALHPDPPLFGCSPLEIARLGVTTDDAARVAALQGYYTGLNITGGMRTGRAFSNSSHGSTASLRTAPSWQATCSPWPILPASLQSTS